MSRLVKMFEYGSKLVKMGQDRDKIGTRYVKPSQNSAKGPHIDKIR